MSVLFKALQKAEKENEQRQAAAGGGFDPSRLAGSGAIKMAGGGGVNWRTAGLSAAVVLAVAIAAAFFLLGTPPQAPAPVAAVAPPSVAPQPVAPSAPAAHPATTVTNVPPGTTETIPLMQPPTGAPAQSNAVAQAPVTPAPAAAAAPAPTQVAAAPAPVAGSVPAASASPPTPAPAPAPAPALASASDVPAPAAKAAEPVAEQVAEDVDTTTGSADLTKRKPAKTVVAAASVPKVAPKSAAMPDLPPDSPARMLNPPIAVQRAEFELAGVGNQVKVREVSQKAQDNVGAGYSALVSGAYDMSLDFYDRALREEPNSVLALLGRGAALQKLGKSQDAHASYEKVLKIDPGNREALSNLTVITAERSPAEALTKLLDLEKQYPAFSPIKAQIGLSYAKMGAMPEALDYLRRALSLTPDSVMYQYNTALVLDHMGQKEQAVAAYETVLASLAGGRAAPELSATEIERRVRYLRVR